MTYARSLFIFRRDLRLEDNTALIRALSLSDEVVAAFIFDPRQCEPHPYFSPHAFQFLSQSLDELSAAIEERGGKLHRFYGRAEDVVAGLLREHRFKAVFINKDYTPFSCRRDAGIRQVCRKFGAVLEAHDDALLCPPGSVLKQAGGPYAVFTPFYKKARACEAPSPARNIAGVLRGHPLKSPFALKAGQLPEHVNPLLAVKPGRRAGLQLLKGLGALKDYARERDIPSLDATSHLSAHHKFGTLSVRETLQAVTGQLGGDHPLMEQLYWRDFFTHVAYYFPHVFTGCFYAEYDAIPWQNDRRLFKAWCAGRTGAPLVDAGMRELNATGFMHNRLRMVTASFLVKDLHIHWRWGERYFATKLVDYDPAVNNGNWQWAASTGCDHQPYFRVFNPWRQQLRFDPQAAYMRKWVPALRTASLSRIHAPGDMAHLHSDAVQWIKEAFKDAVRRDKTR